MVKFDEDFVLKAGGVWTAAWAIPMVAVPKKTSGKLFKPEVPEAVTRGYGLAISGCAAACFIGASSAEVKVKRNVLKTLAACTLASGANCLWAGFKEKTMPKDLSITKAVAQAAVGIPALVMGFRE